METSREAEERKKVMRLSHGMNAFVEGKSRMLMDPTMPKMGLVSRPRASSTGRTDIRSRSLMGRSSKDPVSLAAQRSVGKLTSSITNCKAFLIPYYRPKRSSK